MNKNKSELTKKPWWYLFLIANILVVLGCAITYFLFKKIDNGTSNFQQIFLPTLICNILSFLVLGFFIVLEYRDIVPKQMHFQKKWIYIYVFSICIFFVAIVFSAIFYIFMRDNWITNWNNELKQIMLIVYLVVPALLTLVSVGINRYARFGIDFDVYRRKHGQNPNDKSTIKKI